MPSAEKPWTTTSGTPRPHTATPTSWPLSSRTRCRASCGIVTRRRSAATSVVVGPTIGVVTSPSIPTQCGKSRRGNRGMRCSAVAERAAGLVAVAVHLGDEVVDRLELLLVAQVQHELHPRFLAVQVA